jgi:MFS family permease
MVGRIEPTEPEIGEIALPDAQVPTTLPPQPRLYRSYALTVLMIIYVLNFLDRQVVSILAEPIKHDLGLADWQLGVMTGLAFAILYTLLGIPVARLAERANRPMIISASVAVFSAFTVFCGLAQNFTQLVLARIGVGIGECGCTPPALSLISDYVPKEKRASAIAFYMLGAPVGGLLGMVVGGLVADAFGWRTAFLVVGAPGLICAVIAFLTLREPRKAMAKQLAGIKAAGPTFRDAMKELAGKKTYWLIVGAVTIKAFISYGSTAFMGSFFFRNHAVELAQWGENFGLKSAGLLGIVLGVATGGAGVIGALAGGRLADHFGAKDWRAYPTIPAIGGALSIPFLIFSLITPSFVLAMALLIIPSVLNSLWYGPSYAAVQGLVRPATRATATAIMLFVANLIGLGLGPLGVGAVSDLLSGPMGLGQAEGLQWSIVGFTLLGVPCAIMFWLARKTIRQEMVS